MTIHEWIQRNTATLNAAGIASARLDVLLLLCDELNRDKAWLLAHDDEQLTPEQLTQLDALLQRRTGREPLAYLRGQQQFYGRNFAVTPAVLIPRPETEAIIELCAELKLASQATIADIGTGSGAIALTIKLERPRCTVIATDVSESALRVARKNAKQLGAVIDFRHGSLLEPLTEPVDVIIANLPYVDRDWERYSPETDFEPGLALFADNHGLALILELLDAIPSKLHSGGFVLLEADPEQHDTIIARAALLGLAYHQTAGYCISFQKK